MKPQTQTPTHAQKQTRAKALTRITPTTRMTSSRVLVLSAIATAATLASQPALAASTAGTVQFSRGDVSIRTPQGTARAAASGAAVESGETIETRSGRAQLRMIDGAYISLQPDTRLTFDSYQLGTTTVPESGFMSLLQGGMRTITGLIGRSQRGNYKLTTPTATIGIRGTEFSVTATPKEKAPVAGEGNAGSASTSAGGNNKKGVGDEGTVIKVVDGMVQVCQGTSCVVAIGGEGAIAPPSFMSPRMTVVSLPDPSRITHCRSSTGLLVNTSSIEP